MQTEENSTPRDLSSFQTVEEYEAYLHAIIDEPVGHHVMPPQKKALRRYARAELKRLSETKQYHEMIQDRDLLVNTKFDHHTVLPPYLKEARSAVRAENTEQRHKEIKKAKKKERTERRRIKRKEQAAKRKLLADQKEIPIYHGSNHKFEIGDQIDPRISFGSMPLVYGTLYKEYAIVRAGQFDPLTPLLREEFHGPDYKTGERSIFELDELEPGAFLRTFNCPGYVYTVKGKFRDSGRAGEDGEVISSDPVTVVAVEEIPNVWERIKRLDGRIYNLVPYGKKNWATITGGYEGYMMRRYARIAQLRQAQDDYKRRMKVKQLKEQQQQQQQQEASAKTNKTFIEEGNDYDSFSIQH